MTKSWRRGVVVLVAFGLVVAACSGDDDDSGSGGGDDGAEASDADAEAAGAIEEWPVEGAEDHGMDPAALEQARAYAFQEDRHTQGVVVVHDGAVVSEWYADGADEDSWTASWSVAKSWTSALVGIAIEEGKIPSVDEPMTTYFPEWANDERSTITLRDVLQMASGLDWDEGYNPGDAGESEIIQMVTGETDQLTYAASIGLRSQPGTEFNYSSGNTMLLSGVIEQATGMPVHEYAQAKLFEPLNMEKAEWWRDTQDHTLTYCCFDSTSRDLARLGQLYLQDGRWGDEQVVPEAWVDESLEPGDASVEVDAAYGYQWWLDPAPDLGEEVFAAQGHDGQFIYVIPSLDLVVVRNGTYVKDPGPPVADPNLFTKYPSDNLVPGRGTIPPASWDETEFLRPIVESLGAG